MDGIFSKDYELRNLLLFSEERADKNKDNSPLTLGDEELSQRINIVRDRTALYMQLGNMEIDNPSMSSLRDRLDAITKGDLSVEKRGVNFMTNQTLYSVDMDTSLTDVRSVIRFERFTSAMEVLKLQRASDDLISEYQVQLGVVRYGTKAGINFDEILHNSYKLEPELVDNTKFKHHKERI